MFVLIICNMSACTAPIITHKKFINLILVRYVPPLAKPTYYMQFIIQLSLLQTLNRN